MTCCSDTHIRQHIAELAQSGGDGRVVRIEAGRQLLRAGGQAVSILVEFVIRLARQADNELDQNTYGLSSRTQELAARFNANHPTVSAGLRQLGNMLSNMGI